MPEREDDGRYAIYFVPPSETSLFRSAAQWLGRDIETGADKPRPAVGDMAWHEIAAITASPKHYGFHATLKPPFRLASGRNEKSFVDAVRGLCASKTPFVLPPLEVGVLGDFVALVLSEPSPEMNKLADCCVTDLDNFRAPATQAELDKRRQSNFGERQKQLLACWGYPYVLEEFRFHMTLTERQQEPGRVREALAVYFAPHLSDPLTAEGIAICRQDRRELPFRILERVAFAR